MNRLFEFFNSRVIKKPYLLFSPFLILYIIIGIYFRLNGPVGGDEGHYFQFADNLKYGFYSPNNNIDVWFGPGFPIYLWFGQLIGIPKLGFVILNAFFLYFTIVFFNQILNKFISNKNISNFSSFF